MSRACALRALRPRSHVAQPPTGQDASRNVSAPATHMWPTQACRIAHSQPSTPRTTAVAARPYADTWSMPRQRWRMRQQQPALSTATGARLTVSVLRCTHISCLHRMHQNADRGWVLMQGWVLLPALPPAAHRGVPQDRSAVPHPRLAGAEAVGRRLGGRWIDASESMLMNPASCNPKREQFQAVHAAGRAGGCCGRATSRLHAAGCMALRTCNWLLTCRQQSADSCLIAKGRAQQAVLCCPVLPPTKRPAAVAPHPHRPPPPPLSVPACACAASYEQCQEECLTTADCVAWMWGVDDDWDCIIDDTCPNLVRDSCEKTSTACQAEVVP